MEAFLSHLETAEGVSTSTQRQALNALAFLYKQVLGIELTDDIIQNVKPDTAAPV